MRTHASFISANSNKRTHSPHHNAVIHCWRKQWRIWVGAALLFVITPSFADESTHTTANIHLEITTYLGDRQTFVEGDRLSFLVTLDRDAYLLVLYETAQQQLIQLFPHQYSHLEKYKAGYYIPVPDENARYQFLITPPFGRERILAFAADREFPSLPGQPLANGLRLLTNTAAQVAQQLRQESEERKGEYGEAELELTTRAR